MIRVSSQKAHGAIDLLGEDHPDEAVGQRHRGEGDDRLPAQVRAQVEVRAKYAGYIERQKDEVERAAHYESLRLPADIDYMAVAALSFEVRQKLATHRPETLGMASRISGVTPAAISLLLVHLKKSRAKGFAPAVVDTQVA